MRANAPPSRYSPGGRTEELFQDAVLDAVLTFENKGFQVAGNRTMHGGNYAVEFEEILKNMQDVCRECGGAGTVWVNDPKNFPKVRVLEFVHVSQLRMVFHKARMHYLAAGEVLDGASELDSEFDKAKVLLTWLNETLEDVINVADPNSQVAGQAQSLMRRVLSLLDYIGMGLNYFGKEPAYVPRQSLAQYERWLNEFLAVLFSIEGHHGKLYEELKGKTKLTLHLAKCASVIDGQKTLCGGQRKRIVKEMALAVSSIADAGTVVANARTATRDAIEKYRIDIENQVKSPDFGQAVRHAGDGCVHTRRAAGGGDGWGPGREAPHNAQHGLHRGGDRGGQLQEGVYRSQNGRPRRGFPVFRRRNQDRRG